MRLEVSTRSCPRAPVSVHRILHPGRSVMASYVIVWEQNMYGQKEIGNREWPGHSSMNIGDHFDKGTFTPTAADLESAAATDAARAAWYTKLSRNYVSYWPATQGATFGVADVFSKRSRSRANTSIADDINVEGYLP